MAILDTPLLLGLILILAGILVLLWPREDEAALPAGIAEFDRIGSEADQSCKSDVGEIREGEMDEGHKGWPRRRGDEAARMRGGAVVMIGPIPIVVGSDPRTALLLMIMALAMMAVYALVIKGFLR
jgi:uncharacterized protein (TIGR00304 family)